MLRVRHGSDEGVSFRFKADGMRTWQEDVEHREEWTRAAIIAGGDAPSGKRYRFFEIEPAAEENRIEHRGFFVEGGFRVLRKENNHRRALEAWKAFEVFELSLLPGSGPESVLRWCLTLDEALRVAEEEARKATGRVVIRNSKGQRVGVQG